MPDQSPIFTNVTYLSASSGVVAAAVAAATLVNAAGRTTYITGFSVTAGGATAGSLINVTVAGLTGGTQTFVFAVPTGVALGAVFAYNFPNPVPASAPNSVIIVSCPSAGAGSTQQCTNVTGFQY